MAIGRSRINVDWPLLASALILSLYGLAIVYSAGQTDRPTFVEGVWKRQLLFMVVGVGGAWFISRASVRMLDWLTVPAYAFTILLLFSLLFIGSGAGTAASTKSWLSIGGFRLQPSELAKLTVVLMLAKSLSSTKESPKTMLELWKPAVIVGIPWLLVLGARDLGTSLVFVGIFFAMLFWSGISWRLLILIASPMVSLVLGFTTSAYWGAWFLVLFALVVWYKPYLWEGVFIVTSNVVMGVVAPLLYEGLKPYQRDRFQAFLNPSIDPRGAAYHVIQSQTAIGSGGMFGQGFTEGSQKRLAFLPEQHTDFIFAVLGEELGFLGVTFALALFLTLFLRIIRIAERANDGFSSMVAFGLLASWFVHVLINVGMTVRLMPITGIPLPFFSYGGTFMLASWLAIGVLLRIAYEGRGGRHGALAI